MTLKLVHGDKLLKRIPDALAAANFDADVKDGVERIARVAALEARHTRAELTPEELVN